MTQSSSWTIRKVLPADASRIASIYSEAILAHDATMILDPVSADEMADKIRSLGHRESILVATSQEDEVVGWGIVKFYSDRPGYTKACETSLFVDVAYRGKGIGPRIQAALMRQAKADEFHHIVVRIWAQNARSITLHEQLGFTMVGIQKEIGHVNQQWIDVAVMQCLL